MSIGLEVIRQGGPGAVASKLQTVEGSIPVVINAAGYGDLAVVVLGLLRAEAVGKRFLYRTAASFVRLRGAVERKPPLEAKEIMSGTPAVEGGVVVVGSYVPESSTQLENVLTLSQVIGIELPVGRVGVLYTSRRQVTGANRTENLEIGNKVSHALISALRHVKSRPRIIVAKGGITSHDVAQKALGAAQARVLGQLFYRCSSLEIRERTAIKIRMVCHISCSPEMWVAPRA